MRLALLVLLLVASCVTPPPGPPGESHSVQFDWPTHGVPQLDLLFVVDDTAAMAPYRERTLALGPFAAFALQDYTAGMPDLHIAVARATGGPLTTISDVHNNDGSRRTSYTGELADVLTSMLDVGTTSTAASQPLAAIERAIADTDFVRPDTNLMTVTITASDDQSLDSVDHYLAATKSELRSGVYPATAPRLDAFSKIKTPLDGADYTHALSPITDIIIDFLEPCFEEPLPEPYQCSISMIEEGHETVLASCDVTPTGPCWMVVTDNNCVSDRGIGQTIDVRGYKRIYRPRLVGECVTQ